MNSKHSILALMIFLVSCQVKSQDRINIIIPSAEYEAQYIYTTIQSINFFEEYNYQLSLPKGGIIEELKQKAKTENLNDDDYDRLEKFVLDSVYNESDYLSGYEKINNELALINKMIDQIDESNYNWDFKEFATYDVNLTLYGPGGSYQPEEGSLLIYTTIDGEFKGYDNPANIVIHEIVHIGIEESIITKYNVPHAFKERIVDSYVSLNYGPYLPNYRIQEMGDLRIDKYIKEVGDFRDLDKAVEKALNDKLDAQH